ncbi:hypothetical protein I8H83_01265 [Candidatus Saccharibacteria bacterium]|nr:hypothetical protein [Candidatus Saccharibacteria bacterium]MBH2007215.1 hypothetical protein [Candidatus Saccharibacteria bacterium]
MSRALMTLLGRPADKLLSIAFDDLEKATGTQAIDAKLVGDILHIAHTIIREMGLEGDATARELYHALRVHEDVLGESTRYAGLVVGGEVVSFHHDDVVTDNEESRRFEDRSLEHLQAALADQIVSRYKDWAAHPELLQKITKYIQVNKERKI